MKSVKKNIVQPVFKPDSFDALCLVDCFDEKFLRELCLDPWDYTTRGFYGRLLDYLERFEFDRVYATDTYPVHHWFRERYPQIELVNQKSFSTNIVNQKLFVAGQSWHICLHSKNGTGFYHMHLRNTVYSSPHAVAHYWLNKQYVSELDFENDPYAEWTPSHNHNPYLQKMKVWRLINLHTPQ